MEEASVLSLYLIQVSVLRMGDALPRGNPEPVTVSQIITHGRGFPPSTLTCLHVYCPLPTFKEPQWGTESKFRTGWLVVN